MGLHWFDGIIALYDNLVARFRRQPRVVYVRRDENPDRNNNPEGLTHNRRKWMPYWTRSTSPGMTASVKRKRISYFA